MKPSNKPLPTPVEWQIKKVGIALAAYKPDPVYFEMQLKSIQDQTFSNWNCWITLDSSLGELKQLPVLEPFFNDPRFIWSENTSRLGHKKNFEHAMNLAAADPSVDAIACSDQDDVWYPEKLEKSRAALKIRGPGSLVHCDMHILNTDGSIAAETAWSIEKRGVHNSSVADLTIRNIVAGCAMLLDANLVRNWGEIPDSFDYHDHWFAVVAAAHGGVFPIKHPLYAYRQHGGNVVGVSPYRGFFHISSEGRSPHRILKKIRNAAQLSINRSEAITNTGLPVGPKIFRSKFAFGFGFLCLAIKSWPHDKALARAALARAFGSII